jgi:DNA helicase-2/ATP-dependent DNA helicase PcrA
LDEVPGLGRAASKINPFVLMIQSMKAKAKLISVQELLSEVIDVTGYVRELEAEGTEEAKVRIENIDELISKAADYDDTADEPSLGGFLEEVALVADIDSLDADTDYVVLMTLHSAKGLEFPNVYLAGLEDGLFPSYMSITSDNGSSEVEEERRLAYVGITRAMRELTITAARTRMIRGQTQFNTVSRYVKEIPSELLDGKIYEAKTYSDQGEPSTYAKARKNFRSVPDYGTSPGYGDSYGRGFTGKAPQSGGGNISYGSEVGEGYGSTFGRKQKAAVHVAPQNQRDFGAAAAAGGNLSYEVGDRVRHIKFGEGEVTSIVSGGRDYEVTVDFDRVGTKKMFAAFAKLKKI